jgi:hypothetical protein
VVLANYFQIASFETENEKADYISRLIDHEDWEVSGKIFDLMNGLWGPFTIDRFANFNNKKLNRYNSLYWNPGSEAIDAFSQNWQYENNWPKMELGFVPGTNIPAVFLNSKTSDTYVL